MKENIKNYNLEELKELIETLGEKKYRAEQIFSWIYKERVKSFDEMTNLPNALREKLKENYDLHTFKIICPTVQMVPPTKNALSMASGKFLAGVTCFTYSLYSLCCCCFSF